MLGFLKVWNGNRVNSGVRIKKGRLQRLPCKRWRAILLKFCSSFTRERLSLFRRGLLISRLLD